MNIFEVQRDAIGIVEAILTCDSVALLRLLYFQGTFANEVKVVSMDKIHVTREVDGGLETLSLTLPAVVTCDLRLNEPRFATLPNVMKARKKKIESFDHSEHDIDLTPSLTTLSVAEPATRPAGVVVSSVDELIDKLQNEAKVI